MQIATFVFYLVVLISVVFSYRRKWKNYNWYAITIITLVLGLRGCGIDTRGYIETFRFYLSINAGLFNPAYYDPDFNILFENDLHVEWFYLVLIKIIKLFSTSSVWYFLILDFMSTVALDRFIRRFSLKEKEWILYFFFTGLFFVNMFNLMRQCLSFLIFLNLLDFIERKKLIHYIVGVLILYVFFHKSAIMLIPFYFVVDKNFLKSNYLQGCIYFVVVAFSVIFIEQLKIIMDMLYFHIGGTDVIKVDYLSSETQVIDMKVSYLTIFFYSTVMIYMILHSSYFKTAYGTLGVIMYNFTYLGMLLVNVAYNRGVERINIYFISFSFLVLGLMIYQSLFGYFKRKKEMQIYTYGIILLYIAWFANAVFQGAAGCAPYKFNSELFQ